MKMNRWLAFGLCAVTAGTPFLIAAPAAHAYQKIGCKFAGSDPTIVYSVGTLGSYTDQVIGAANAWNAKSIPGRFSATYSGTANIYTRRMSSLYREWAWVGSSSQTAPSCLGLPVDVYSGNNTNIVFNETQMNLLTSGQRKLVAMHELGHTYGLGHMPTGCSLTKSIMQQSQTKWTCGWSGTPPYSDDVDGVRAIYN